MMTANLHPPALPEPKPEPRPHHLECLCESCERTGGGRFAEQAALDGDPTAKARLSPAVYHFLVAERKRRRGERLRTRRRTRSASSRATTDGGAASGISRC